jgi:hypothetical protein
MLRTWEYMLLLEGDELFRRWGLLERSLVI